jgi:Cu+-exporting ATPase
MIYAGGKQIGNSVYMSVLKEVEASYLAQLWKEKINKNEDSLRISSILNNVSKYFTIIILLIATVSGIVWMTVDPFKVIFAFSSVLIVACPCALALSIPFAFGHGRAVLGKWNFFLKDASIIENLSKADTVVFDKTGTLTDPNSYEIEFFQHGNIKPDFSVLKSVFKQSNHPLSRAIFQYLYEHSSVEVDSFSEVAGKGIEGIASGKKLRLGSAEFLQIQENKELNTAKVYIEVDGDYQGYFSVRNHYRVGWEELIQKIGEDYDVHLLSGDNDSERAVISKYVKNVDNLHFKQTPVDKLNYIKKLQKENKNVIMIGDGLNDAGALKESLAGISVADDVYQFTPSSDAIIGAKSLIELPHYLKFSSKLMNIVYASFVLSFMYNIVGLYYASTGQLSPLIAAILMPLSSVTIVAFTSFSTIIYSKFKK